MFYAMEVKREGGNEDRAFSGWAQSPWKQTATEVKESSDGLHQTFPWLFSLKPPKGIKCSDFISLLIPHFPCSGPQFMDADK